MKIGDVKVGDILGLDCSERYSRALPRRVEVVEITKVEESYWGRGGYMAAKQTRNVRRVKVKFLDEPVVTRPKSRYARYDYVSEAKDAIMVVEARFLIGPWVNLKKSVQEQLSQAQAEADAKRTAESRLEYLLGKKIDQLSAYITVHHTYVRVFIDLRVDGDELDTLLTLAERGKRAVE